MSDAPRPAAGGSGSGLAADQEPAEAEAAFAGAGQAGLRPGGQGPGAHASGGSLPAGPGPGPREPAPRGRRPRPRTRWRTAFFALAGTAIVAGVAWALLGNRLLVVRSVSVTGTRLVTTAQVINAADVPVGTPLFSVDAGSVTRRVAAIRQVASVTVSKDWPDHLVIAVTERVPSMAVKMAGGGYDQVDKSGVIVRWTKARPATLPLLATPASGGALAGNPEVGAVAGVLAELRPWLAKQVSGVKAAAVAAGTEQVTLSLRDGQAVQWGSTGNAARKNRELSVLLPGGARYIDVSAPGTVVTRLFSATGARQKPRLFLAAIGRNAGVQAPPRKVFADVVRNTRRRAAWLVDHAA